MHRSSTNSIGRPRNRLWRWIAVAILCLGVAGCAKLNLRGESYNEDNVSGMWRHLRPADPKADAWGVSNKARQIEKDLGH